LTSVRRTIRLALRLLLLLTVVARVGGACASSGAGDARPERAALSGRLNVLAAASLTESFDELEHSLETSAPKLDLTMSFAGSQALVQQIQDGAPADVFASADAKNMQKLVDAGIVETPMIFVRNKLEIAVSPGNPKHVTTLADLERSDLLVVLADPAVPVGNYAQQVLARAGLTVRPKSLELDVKAALARVSSGEADAAIVYASDVDAAGSHVAGVTIADADNIVASYPIAVVKASGNKRAARAFIAAVRSAKGQALLRRHGFGGAES
jgi:molybdate transport system substrate-binding protein